LETQRSASINFRQAIGILLMGFSLIVAFSAVMSVIINIMTMLLKTNKYSGPESMLGMVLAAMMFLVLTAFLAGFALYLLNDPNGYNWGRKK